MLPAQRRQPLPNPLTTSSTRVLATLISTCGKYSIDLAAQAVITASEFLLKNSTYTETRKDLFSKALLEGLIQYLNENKNKQLLDELKSITINTTINATVKSISESIYGSLTKDCQNQNCLVLLINSISAVQTVITASLSLSRNSTYTDAQKDLFSNALFEGLRQYLKESGHEQLLDELTSIVINPTTNATVKPISETTCYSLKKDSQDQNCLVRLINSTSDAGSHPFYPYYPNDMLFKITDDLEKKDIASLHCASRFFARSVLVRKENEKSLIWPGMTCNIASVDRRRFKPIFITNALGQSFVWDTNATSIPLSLCQSTLAEDTMHKSTPLIPTGEQIKRIVTDNGSIFTQSVSEKWFAYGNNAYGQLGLGHNNQVNVPTLLPLPNGEKIKTVITNYGSTFIQSVSGQWFVCGNNDIGQLSLGHNNPVNTLTSLSLPNGEKIKTVIITDDYSTFIQSIRGQWFVCGNNDLGQLGLGHNNPVNTLTSLSLPNGEKIKTVIITDNYTTFIQSISGQWFVCGHKHCFEHNTNVHMLTSLSLPLSFCLSLTDAQTTSVDSLIETVISQNPISIADFLGRLLFAYAEQSKAADSSLAKEMAFTLLSQQPSTYPACVRLIQGSGLLEAAAKLPDSNDDSLNLLCVCKKLYDKDFPQRVEDILSQAKNTELKNQSLL